MNSQKITFGDFSQEWLEFYKKDSGIRTSTFVESYERTVSRYLIPVFGVTAIEDITPLDIRKFVKKMSKTYSKSTVSKNVICLNQIFRAAIENRLCDRNPAANIQIRSSIEPSKRKTYSDKEVKDIIEFTNKHSSGIYIHIMLELGLRCSELCGLQWGDIDFERKVIHIRRACTACQGIAHIDTTKNETSYRTLPVSTVLIEKLCRVAQSHKPDQYIAPSKRNDYKPLTPSSFTKGYYDDFFKAYGFDKRLPPHSLGHTCGTLLYDRCHDIYAVSKFMGHSSINITAKLYVHPDAEMLRSALGIE